MSVCGLHTKLKGLIKMSIDVSLLTNAVTIIVCFVVLWDNNKIHHRLKSHELALNSLLSETLDRLRNDH